MTVDVDITVGDLPIRGIPVPLTTVDVLILGGPCTLLGWSLREAAGEIPGQADGTVLSPGALANIAVTASIPAGTYTVNWTVTLLGAAGAGDVNNFQLVDSAGVVVASLNAGAAGQYPQAPVQVTTTVAGTVRVQSIAAGTAGVTYGADITAIPTLGIAATVEFQDGNQPLGESAVAPGSADTQLMFDDGVQVTGQILLHVIRGAVTGVVYAKLDR